MAALLEIADLYVEYDGSAALRGASLHVDPGEVVAVVGANGAGKTTLLRAVAGLKEATSGRVVFDGEPALGEQTRRLVERGLAFVPQERALFPHMTVEDNLRAGGHLCRTAAERAEGVERVLARFPALRERRRQRARTLSGGEQQMLAIGRALVRTPRLLLLDEPSFALAPAMVATISRTIEDLSRAHTSVLLVEQNVRMALAVAQRAYVLGEGHVVFSAPAAQLLADERVRDAYLGRTTDPPPASGSSVPPAARAAAGA